MELYAERKCKYCGNPMKTHESQEAACLTMKAMQEELDKLRENCRMYSHVIRKTQAEMANMLLRVEQIHDGLEAIPLCIGSSVQWNKITEGK